MAANENEWRKRGTTRVRGVGPAAGGAVSEDAIRTIWADAIPEGGEFDSGKTIKAGAHAEFDDPEPIVVEPQEVDSDEAATMLGDPDRTIESSGGELDSRASSLFRSSKIMTYKGANTVTLRLSRLSGIDNAGAATGPGEDGDFESGDFRILRTLGHGGMGVVYLARQASLNRDVALKMVLPAAARRKGVRDKLVSEALVTGELDHPNIIPIHDLAHTSNDSLFYTMKVMRGQPWSGVILEKSERENIEILMRVADALAFAHDKGIIHRDLKPENVMLGDYGEVVLMDWGLAASIHPDSMAEDLTDQNAKAGTPAYMAPEMALGRADRINAWSDIYLLGAVLFEILTGKRPHTGRTVYVCLQAAAENFIVEHDRNDELVQVALKAMATEPSDRYPSVKDFQKDLSRVLSHSEALILMKNAELSLRKADLDQDYECYAQSVFAFREAYKLWPDNTEALAGERRARKRYAAAAFEKGDYDLAQSNVLDLADPTAAELSERIEKARAAGERRKRLVRVFGAAAVALLLIVAAVMVAATIIVRDQMEKEREARAIAESLQKETARASRETLQAREAELAAAKEREEALERERKIQDENLAAAREREAALERERDLQERRLAAVLREQEERRQSEEAERAQRAFSDEQARKGRLEDDSWWTFDGEEAVRRQRRGAEEAGMPVRLDLGLASMPAAEQSFALIPPGQFVMGSAPRDAWHAPDEHLHRVEMTRPFYIGATEVTRGLWRTVVGTESEADLMPALAGAAGGAYRADQLAIWGWRVRPLGEGEASLPATGVSPSEIERIFLPRLRDAAMDGWMFRLPTEAEWEYACRAGTSTRFFNGSDAAAADRAGWTRNNSGLAPHPAASLAANPWGLYDTHGNAGEIVADAYSPTFYLASEPKDPFNGEDSPIRAVRGGTLMHEPRKCRSAARNNMHVENRYAEVGFRLVLARPAE